MANALELAVAGLAATLQLVAQTPVVIRRGGEKSASIDATLSIATYEVLDEELGFPIRVKSHDWIVQRSLLVIGGKSIELRPGDELLTDDGRFEVMPLGKRSCFEPHDARGVLVVVHTKEITCPTQS